MEGSNVIKSTEKVGAGHTYLMADARGESPFSRQKPGSLVTGVHSSSEQQHRILDREK